MIAMHVILFALCLVASAFFSGIETGVISINRMRLRHHIKEGRRAALILHDMLQNPDRLLGTTLIGTNLSNITASVVAASLALQFSPEWGASVSAVVATLVLLIFGEYLPKAWFQALPYVRSARFATTLLVSWKVMRPLVETITLLTRWIVPGRGEGQAPASTLVTREDLKILAHEVERAGTLSRTEREMIHHVFELPTKRARDVMVPIRDAVTLRAGASVKELCDLARQHRYTRIPVLDDTGARYAGIVNMFDVMSTQDTQSKASIRQFMRPVQYIPEDMPIDDILPRLRASRQAMCLVRNAAGEVLGLVTTEDILSEIVGEL
jgi:CBS domain containing-hemolysin-like protein